MGARMSDFKISHPHRWDDETFEDIAPEILAQEWIVALPHKCGAWDIVGTYNHGASKDEALAVLQAFIKDAHAALDRLVRGEVDA